MVKIRLSRGGVRRKPFYQIVAIEEGQRAKGVALEIIGYWQPSKDLVKIDSARLSFWKEKGAKVSKAVSALLVKSKK